MFVGDPWIWIWVRGAKSLDSRRDFGAGEFWRNARIDEIFPRVREVGIHYFFGDSYASDKVTQISQTGIHIFLNKASIAFYSKHQNCVDTSTFGSDFYAMKQAIKLLKALQ